MHAPSDHFKGKSAFDHLKEAREKGSSVTQETHGVEPSGAFVAALDAGRDTAMIIALLCIVMHQLAGLSFLNFSFLALIIVGLTLWKMGRSCVLSWQRLSKLHRLISEEKWEIEHNREQERTELKAMYKAKGFEGKLLEDAIEVLMADDNRLLQVMLEEELGIPVESFEHPVKQGFGAAVGVLIAGALCLVGMLVFSMTGIYISAAIAVAMAAIISAKVAKLNITSSLVWHGAIAFATLGFTYFIAKALKGIVS